MHVCLAFVSPILQDLDTFVDSPTRNGPPFRFLVFAGTGLEDSLLYLRPTGMKATSDFR